MIGINQLHAKNICHRDLKPDNLLISNGIIKVADLGCSKILKKEGNNPYVVSQHYRSPELLLGLSDYNNSIDIWSFGVIFFEFLFKFLPFYSKTEGG